MPISHTEVPGSTPGCSASNTASWQAAGDSSGVGGVPHTHVREIAGCDSCLLDRPGPDLAPIDVGGVNLWMKALLSLNLSLFLSSK